MDQIHGEGWAGFLSNLCLASYQQQAVSLLGKATGSWSLLSLQVCLTHWHLSDPARKAFPHTVKDSQLINKQTNKRLGPPDSQSHISGPRTT